MICPICGAQAPEQATNCPNCGNHLTQQQPLYQQNPQYPQQPQYQQQQQQYPQYPPQPQYQQTQQQPQYRQPQYQQQYTPTPVAAKKSKTPLIAGIVGGVVVIALAVVLIVTGVFGLVGGKNNKPDTNISAPQNTSRPTNPGNTNQPTTPGNTNQPTTPGNTNQPTNPGNPGGSHQPSDPGGFISNTFGINFDFSPFRDVVASGDYDISDWPSYNYPPGFPSYPNASVAFSSDEYDMIMICVVDTDRAEYGSYLSLVEANGWFCIDDDAFDEPFYIKDSWFLWVTYDEEYGVFIFLWDTGDDELAALFIPVNYDWPADIPIPAYTDGRIWSVDADAEAKSYYIFISDSSKAAYDSYIDKLLGAGWKHDGDYWYILETQDGEWYLSVSFDDDGDVFIGLDFIPQ